MPSPASPSQPVAVHLDAVSVERGGRQVLAAVDLTLTERTRMAVVGPNGAGKSTLLAVLAGRLDPHTGRRTLSPPTATIGLLAQEPVAGADGSVREVIAERVGVAAARREFDQATEALATGAPAIGVPADAALATDPSAAADRYDSALARYLDLGVPDFDARLEEAADRLGLASDRLDVPATVVSGGEAARVGLITIQLSRFDLTLLDEPTNNLDRGGLAALDRWVENHAGGLVVVSHDRAFLERTVTSVAEIDGHLRTLTVFEGGWTAYLEERRTAATRARERYDSYVDERDRLRARVQRQREWVDQGASRARKRPADNDKILRNLRVASTERLAGRAAAGERALDRLDVVEKPWEGWELRFDIAHAQRSADVVAVADAAVWTRGDFTLGPIDVEIRWADRVALVGPNGSGKSTLLAGLLGRLAPLSGTAGLGAGVVVGELTQSRPGASSETGLDALAEMQHASGLDVTESRSLLAKFGLESEAIARPLASLSPGERTRLGLAVFQARGVNLVILDEPTNHLDLEAIEQLEQALAGYTGTLVVVSHDERFLESLTITDTIELR